MKESKLKSVVSLASEVTLPEIREQPSSIAHHQSNSILSEKSTPPLPPPRTDRLKTAAIKTKDVLCSLLIKFWFLLGLAVVIILAWQFPSVAKTNGYIRAEWTIKWGAVIIIFLISGLSLRTQTLAKTVIRIRLHLLVQIINLVIIPFFVFGVVLFFLKVHLQISSLLLIGMVIAASTPTTVSSNVVMTKNANGNEATALMNAALGNILGIFISPALVSVFEGSLLDATPETENPNGAGGSINFASVIKQLGLTVLAPLVVGQLIQVRFSEKVAKLKVKLRFSDISNVMLLLLVWSVFSDAVSTGSFGAVAVTDIVIVAVFNAIFYCLFSFLSLFLARLPLPSCVRTPSWVRRLRYSREDTVAVMYCAATKTVALGVPLINVLFKDGNPGTVGVLSTPLLLYHVEQLILGNIEVQLLKKWVKKGQSQDAEVDPAPPPRDAEEAIMDGSATRVGPSGIGPSKIYIDHPDGSIMPVVASNVTLQAFRRSLDKKAKDSDCPTEIIASASDLEITADKTMPDEKPQ